MSQRIGIIQYGSGNVLSVYRAFEAIGSDVSLIDDPLSLSNFDSVILPGVGAFGDAMDKLHSLGFISALQRAEKEGQRILGICLGMQLLFDDSDEFGLHNGLGFLKGSIRSIRSDPNFNPSMKIPNINWLPLTSDSKIITRTTRDREFYFVHSYVAVPADPEIIMASAYYGEVSIPAIVQKGNLIGFQFHPEKSREAGLELLEFAINSSL